MATAPPPPRTPSPAGSISQVCHSYAFVAGQKVRCGNPACQAEMCAPTAAPAIRCASCRMVIYPAQPATTAAATDAAELARRTAANSTAPLLVLLGLEGTRSRLLDFRRSGLGLRELSLLRRCCKGTEPFVATARRFLPPIVLLGGEQERFSGKLLDEVRSLDIGSMSFHTGAQMPSKRSGLAACVLADGRVVVAGGATGSWAEGNMQGESSSATVCANGVWSELPPMTETRHGARAVALDNGRVMVVGGSRGELYLNTAEVLDIAKGKWTALPPTHHRYVHFAIGKLHDGRVIVAGGLTSGKPGTNWRLAEVYDPVSNRWSELPPLAGARAFCAVRSRRPLESLMTGLWLARCLLSILLTDGPTED